MRVALAEQLGGIDGVELGDRPDPVPAAGQVLVRVHGAGVGPWDVGFLSGGFPGLACRSSRARKSLAWSKRPAMGRRPAAHIDRQRLEALRRLVDAGTLRPQVEAVLPLEQARAALAQVAGRHTRGKIVLQIGQ